MTDENNITVKEKLNKINQKLEWLRKSKVYLEDKFGISAPNVDPNSSEQEIRLAHTREKLCLDIEKLKKEQKKAEKLFTCYDKKLKHKYREYKKYCNHT